MSLADKKEEAEAILDSAEMLLETYGGTGETARELRKKITELENEIQDPESESSLDSLIKDVKELMDKLQEQPMGDEPMGPEDEMGGMGPEQGGMGPDEGAPPF